MILVRCTDPEKVLLLRVLFALDPELSMHRSDRPEMREPEWVVAHFGGYSHVQLGGEKREFLCFSCARMDRTTPRVNFPDLKISSLLEILGIPTTENRAENPPEKKRVSSRNPRFILLLNKGDKACGKGSRDSSSSSLTGSSQKKRKKSSGGTKKPPGGR